MDEAISRNEEALDLKRIQVSMFSINTYFYLWNLPSLQLNHGSRDSQIKQLTVELKTDK
jgi:hypothetical protein